MAAGWMDFLRKTLGWLGFRTGTPPTSTPRTIPLEGDVGTTISLEGDVLTTISLSGDVATTIPLEGDLMARHQPWDCFSGEDVSLPFTVYDVDLSAATLSFVLKATPEDTTTLVSKTSGSGITATYSSSTGDSTVTVSLSSANLSLTAGTYYYSLARKTSGAYAILAYGEVLVGQATALP